MWSKGEKKDGKGVSRKEKKGKEGFNCIERWGKSSPISLKMEKKKNLYATRKEKEREGSN